MASALLLSGLTPLRRRLSPQGTDCCRSGLIPIRAAARDEPKAQPIGDAGSIRTAILSVSALLGPTAFCVDEAMAKGGEYGLLEGRIASVIHPGVMLVLLGSSVYAGWMGWQWRRTREIGNEIKELKKALPAVGEDGKRPASPLDAEIADLEAIRKELVAGGYRDRHYNQGSILLAAGVAFAFYGATNTFLRADKLFPGPHLYAGCIIVVLWALAAGLVPAMQKGNEAARIGHIALNATSTLVFISQVPTGFDILGKVLELTSFP